MKKIKLHIITLAALLFGFIAPSFAQQGHQIKDVDGNYYNIVSISSQVWMQENLKTTKYNDGTGISYPGTDNAGWQSDTTGAYAWYNNDESAYKNLWGALYNWFALDSTNNGDKNVCPVGWHVPTDEEWKVLEINLGMTQAQADAIQSWRGTDQGKQMKSITGWSSLGVPYASNTSGFTALPGGTRTFQGYFSNDPGSTGCWWSTTPYLSINAIYRTLHYQEITVGRFDTYKHEGFSVRCLHDGGTLYTTPSLNTTTASSITQTSAQSGGNITDIGNVATIDEKGICWSNSPNPTINDNMTSEGPGAGSYTSSITGLTAGTTYYVRAYATNSIGTAYGDEKSFTTYKPDAITDSDGNFYNIVTIGTQVWMAENLKTTRYKDGIGITNVTDNTTWASLTTPAYAWYDNNLNNKETFGALYNWYTVETGKLCPSGWHAPADPEWTVLTNRTGGESNAGGNLKEIGTAHWESPNSGAEDAYGFTALPAGARLLNGGFYSIGLTGIWWSAKDTLSTYAFHRFVHYNDIRFSRLYDSKTYGMSVRCLQNTVPLVTTMKINNITQTTAQSGGYDVYDGGEPVIQKGVCWSTTPNPAINLPTKTANGSGTSTFSSIITGLTPGTTYYMRAYATNSIGTAYGNEISFTTYKEDAISDIDGNYYNTVEIGSQVWISENLKTTRYNNGTDIPLVSNNATWSSLTTPGYCWYNNDGGTYKNTYGALYNWYTVNTGNLCPSGWHVPTDAEWTGLTDFLGSNAGGKLKESGFDHWTSPNEGATNNSGFTALPGGYRNNLGVFDLVGTQAYWWSKTEYDNPDFSSYSWFRYLMNTDGDPHRMFAPDHTGTSVRCLKTINPLLVTNVDDNGTGSLRNALQFANSNAGRDTITFNIAGTGPFTIQPLSPLPPITDPVVIDGYSQPGASSKTSVMLIRLDGTKAGTGSNGLTISADNCSVKGLVISQFSGNGIQITSGSGNLISSNSISDNSGQGINLGTDGVTPNDTGDPDTGPNNLQNFPVLETISFSTGTVTITGSLNSEASKTCNIEFFVSKVADNTEFGEGQTYLGSQTVTTDTGGDAAFSGTFTVKSSWGTVITATATDPSGNTSEFSKAMGGLEDQIIAPAIWPLHYTINQDGVPDISDGSDLDAVRSSFQTWTEIPTADISFDDSGTTTARYANASDGVNLVSFEDDQFPFSYGVLAVAAKTLIIDQTSLDAQIVDADIVVNPDFVNDIKYNLGVGYNNANAGYFDIQSVITHEIGHILGLLHTGVVNSTMFFTLGSGTTVRTLEQDDKSWASYRYPNQSGYNSTFGSISGNITYGYDSQPVAGTLVYAINTASNDSVHAYSDAEGDYLVPGLIPGSYSIYIEPLDGNVNGFALRPGNISSYIYCNTVYTDYPGEFYSGNNELSDDTNDNKLTVNVSAGATTQGINLVTNKDITPPSVVKVRPTDLSGDLINILSNFSIRFSEPVDETSLSSGTCYLAAGTKTIGGSYTTLTDSVNVIMFDPEAVLEYNTQYTLYITAGVKDIKGNPLHPEYTKSYTTVSEDDVHPRINEVIPANGAGEVFVSDKIRVFFSEPMNKSSVEQGFSLHLTDANGTKLVGGLFSWDNDNVSVTYTPSGSLQEGTAYTLDLAATITDLSGNNLLNSGSRYFKTVDQAAPTIIYYGPANGTTDVPVTTPVVVDFSEPVNTSTVNSATFKLVPGSNPPSGSIAVMGTIEFLNDNSRVVFRPDADLSFNQTYTIVLTEGIEDVSLTGMKFAGQTTTFTTSANPALPHITYVDPSSGIIGAVVTIAGTGFDPDPSRNSISFNGIAAAVKGASLTTLTTEVPLAALSGPVSVTVSGKSSDNTMHFSIIPQSLDPCSDIIANKSTGSNSSHGADVTPDGAYAYVTNPDEGTVTAVSLTDLEPASAITVGSGPVKIDINPLGTRAYITNFNSHTVSVIDIATNSPSHNKVIATISVGIEPYGIAVTPDGKRVYVSNYYSENLSLIDVDPNSGGFDHVVANVSTGSKSGNVAVTPDAGMVLVTGDFGLKIINANPADKDYNSVIANVSSGTKTKDVAVTPDAGLAIVSTEEGHLLVINLHPENEDYTDAVIANVNTGTKVSDVKVSGDGLFVYVTDTDNDQILVYQIGVGGSGTANGSGVAGLTLILHNTIPVGDAPEGLVINDDASKLYVVDTKISSGEREVITVAICCGPVSPSKAIGDLIISIQNLINNGSISEAKGNALIKKLNEALNNLYKGKTKTAANNLGAVKNEISSLIKSGKLPSVQGKALISSINTIITQLDGTKSALTETYIDDEQLDQDVISGSKLGVIYPNPFSETITINYEIAESNENFNKVLIKVYDINGRLVKTLVDNSVQGGRYTIDWDGRYEQGSRAQYGTYFVLFRNGNVEEVKAIMLIK